MKIGRKQAIRLKCIDCCCGQVREVKRCTVYGCPLWNFRMGTEIKQDDAFEDDEEEIDKDNLNNS